MTSNQKQLSTVKHQTHLEDLRRREGAEGDGLGGHRLAAEAAQELVDDGGLSGRGGGRWWFVL